MNRALRVLRIVIVAAAIASVVKPHHDNPSGLGARLEYAYWQPGSETTAGDRGMRLFFTALSVIILLAE